MDPKATTENESSSANNKHWASGLEILIAGAGPASLSFAQALHRNWDSSPTISSSPPPRIRIYERETLADSTSAAREGYSLSLRSDPASGGMQALAKLGVLDHMLAQSITGVQGDESGAFALWNARWKELLRVGSDPDGPSDGLPVPHMRIARNVMRKVLIESLPDEVQVTWGVAVVGAEWLDDDKKTGRLKVKLSNDDMEECDILIAADGASSKLRKALRPNDELEFAGAVCIAGTARFADGEVPKPVDRDWGLALGSGNGTGLFVSPIDTKSAVWSLSYRAEIPRAAGRPMSPEMSEEVLKEALERGKGFAEPFETLVRATDRETLMLFSAMDRMAFHHSFVQEKNGSGLPVIFIGDANHAVSPFAGNGANMALMDGVELAERICHSSELREAVKEYDGASVPRSRKALKISRWIIDLAHAKGLRLWVYLVFMRLIRWFLMRG